MRYLEEEVESLDRVEANLEQTLEVMVRLEPISMVKAELAAILMVAMMEEMYLIEKLRYLLFLEFYLFVRKIEYILFYKMITINIPQYF